ncbi:MAG: hypothetical protein IPN55_02830 [Saprospiraceae bacterium]|nr:hypothetical protein [Candidatus Brachybacter algidus]
MRPEGRYSPNYPKAFHYSRFNPWSLACGERSIFTIKESLLRAGKASMEYIEGKRIKYYNVFYLSLLLLGLNIFLIHYFQKTPEHNLEIGGDMTAVTEFLKVTSR